MDEPVLPIELREWVLGWQRGRRGTRQDLVDVRRQRRRDNRLGSHSCCAMLRICKQLYRCFICKGGGSWANVWGNQPQEGKVRQVSESILGRTAECRLGCTGKMKMKEKKNHSSATSEEIRYNEWFLGTPKDTYLI